MGIESTYFHVMSVSRMQDVVDEWGGTVQEYAPVPLLQLIPCGYSQSKRNGTNATQTESANVVSYNPKVFCAALLDIKAGDRITINFGDKVIGEFTASEPYIYDSHQEVPLLKVGEA